MQSIRHKQRQRARIFAVEIGLQQDSECVEEYRKCLRRELLAFERVRQSLDNPWIIRCQLDGLSHVTRIRTYTLEPLCIIMMVLAAFGEVDELFVVEFLCLQ